MFGSVSWLTRLQEFAATTVDMKLSAYADNGSEILHIDFGIAYKMVVSKSTKQTTFALPGPICFFLTFFIQRVGYSGILY